MIIPTRFGDATVLGGYGVAQVSGSTVSLGALAHMASLRWAPVNNQAVFCVVTKIMAGWSVNAAVTAATVMDLRAIIARGFTTNFTTNRTLADMATVTDTNKYKQTLASSAMGANGPCIATTAAMSGQTLTADANAFAMTAFANQPSGNGTVTQAIGVGHPAVTLYEWTGGVGRLPITLATNEGIVIQPITAGPTTGSVLYYITWEWLEVTVYS